MPKADGGGGGSKPAMGGLGGLFANGVPRKPSEAKNLQNAKPVQKPIVPANSAPPPPPPSAAAKPAHSAVSSAAAAFNNNNTTAANNNHHHSSGSPSPAPAPPPKLKPTPASAPTLQSPKKSPSPPQQHQLAAALRPTGSPASEPPTLKKQESREVKDGTKQIMRPGAPPPPPPVAPPAQSKPTMNKPPPKISPPVYNTNNHAQPATQPVRPAPPVPKQASVSHGSNAASTSCRHPDAFIGFRKEYQNGYTRQAAPSRPPY
ncbi:hypothetical protein M3Y99_00389000 [Aphelenchoides fujianensis]|nr:hypothetical protein M3Y99_00389000 [Aphelenchoides fujianensis]